MGTCIICGIEVDGHICPSHEEDVYFEFTGTEPDQLKPNRFYQGTVDGYADFGVFVDIGPHVTGLLHRSELPRRLESLDWEPGDEVYVQVTAIRDNGNVDLGWSIRQAAEEFRGYLRHTTEGDELPESVESGEPAAPEPETESSEGPATPEPEAESSEGPADAGAEPASTAEPTEDSTATGSTASGDTRGPSPSEEVTTGGGAAMETPLARSEVAGLSDEAGSPVRLEGEVVEIRQTGGPTIFELRDETGTVDCAAFEAAGVRAYPDIEAGDFVRIDGMVEEHRGEVQVEADSMARLEDEERAAVIDRIEAALDERAKPVEFEPLVGHPGVEASSEAILEAATAIRRAAFEARPVVIRHRSSADGYIAAAAIEQALLPLVRAEHDQPDAEYHYVHRRPLESRVYGLADAMRDVTRLLDARDRHGEKVPLFVFVGAGSTAESVDALDLLSVYGAKRVAVDGEYPDESATEAVDTFVSPHLADAEGAESASSTALGANLAVAVNPDVRESVRHLPAVSYWRDPPSAYVDLAAEAGFDETATGQLREAVALEAFYHVYDDKRELVADLLFGEASLAAPASEQFRTRLDTAVRTAEPHLEEWSFDGAHIGVLDVDAYTHRYDFPPPQVLLSALADRAGDLDAVVGLDADELAVWSRGTVDVRELAEVVQEATPDAGAEVRGGRDGTLVFLAGERDAVLEAVIPALRDQL